MAVARPASADDLRCAISRAVKAAGAHCASIADDLLDECRCRVAAVEAALVASRDIIFRRLP
eukprot:815185-Lingulodinium_polyedra.AAC.1